VKTFVSPENVGKDLAVVKQWTVKETAKITEVDMRSPK
jgi:hypothetical protein